MNNPDRLGNLESSVFDAPDSISICHTLKHPSYTLCRLLLSEKALTNKDNGKKESPEAERYTIFHAIFEAMKERDKKHKRR